MGDPGYPLGVVCPRFGNHPTACRAFAGANDGGDTAGGRRRQRARPAATGADRAGGDWLHDRTQHSAHHHRRDTARLAAVRGCRHRGYRGEQRTRLAAHALASAAGHHRRVGFIAWRGHGNDADGCGLRRRHPSRRLHAVCARAACRVRSDHRRAFLVYRRQRRQSRHRLVPADLVGAVRRDLAAGGFRRAVGASAAHSGRTAAVAAGPRHRPAGRRIADDRAAAMAACRQLRNHRMEHRSRLQPYRSCGTLRNHCHASSCRSLY